MCRSKRNVNTVEERKEEVNSLFISSIDSDKVNNNNKDEWFENITINNVKDCKVKLDTGADCNCISVNNLNNITNNIRIKQTVVKLKAFGGTDLQVIGTCMLSCKFINRLEQDIEFIVIQSENTTLPIIIGKHTLKKLELIKRIYDLEVRQKYNFK